MVYVLYLLILLLTNGFFFLYRRNRQLKKKLQLLKYEFEACSNEIKNTTEELNSFSYSVSHDLRAPLRAINGFSRILLKDYSDHLGTDGQDLVRIIKENAIKLNQSIEDILMFSRLGRKKINWGQIDMNSVVQQIFEKLRTLCPDRKINFQCHDLPSTQGDSTLIKQAIASLLDNAIKFTRARDVTEIEIGTRIGEERNIYFIKDNGVGFDMQHASKLFKMFQRLHSVEEFEGNGANLALVQRIIHLHGGEIWAEAQLNQGAIFYFSLPRRQPD